MKINVEINSRDVKDFLKASNKSLVRGVKTLASGVSEILRGIAHEAGADEDPVAFSRWAAESSSKIPAFIRPVFDMWAMDAAKELSKSDRWKEHSQRS